MKKGRRRRSAGQDTTRSPYGRPLVRGEADVQGCRRRDPPIRDDYQLALSSKGDYFTDKLRPKQFIHIDQSECIMCEGCVDICPWKCIHMVSPDAIVEARRTPSSPATTRSDHVRLHHRRRHLHPVRALRRPLPDRRHHPRQGRGSTRRQAAELGLDRRPVGLRHRAA